MNQNSGGSQVFTRLKAGFMLLGHGFVTTVTRPSRDRSETTCVITRATAGELNSSIRSRLKDAREDPFMSLPSPSFASRGAFTACALLAFGLLASEAQARSEVLRFSHSRSDVQSFDARVQDATGNATERSVNLGVPSQDGTGTYFAEIDVEGDVLVSLSATGPSGTSHWSAPRLFEGPPRETPSTIPVGAGVSITPTAGAVARMDFGTSAGGPVVDGWLDTQRDFSLSQDDSLFSTITLGGNRMLHTNSTHLDIHAHVSGGGNPWANIEVR